MADIMAGPNTPITKAFLFCGWRTIPVDWCFGTSHDLSSKAVQSHLRLLLQEATFVFAAMDCSTKSRAREIPRVFQDGRPAPGPLRSEKHPEGLPNLAGKDLERVRVDNQACAFVLEAIEGVVARGGGSIRENPGRSLHWHLPQERRMAESGDWYDTEYSACCFGGARCKYQRLRHNIEEVNEWPPAVCHHTHLPTEWEPQLVNGQRVYPSKEEAEYTAPLAFCLAVATSWWAARRGLAVLKIPRMPPIESVGRREHWLDIHPQACRSWAMTPTALGLGLEPLDAAEAARVPKRGVVTDYLVEGHLPEGVVYVGRGHHSHRLKRSKWACPYVPGHHCAADEWAPRYIEHIALHLWDNLGELQGHTLVCDCPVEVYCERDVLAGLCFDRESSDPRPYAPKGAGFTVSHRDHAAGVARAVILSGAGARASHVPRPCFLQESVVLAFRKLFPGEWFTGFAFPMIEDLINQAPFDCYVRWLDDRQKAWDGPLGPLAANTTSRLLQRHADGQQAGAMNQKAALPPLISHGLDPAEHFVEALRIGREPLPTERPPLMDPDLEFVASLHVREGATLRAMRQRAVGALQELKRRWAPVTARLRTFQEAGIQRVTAKRDLGLTALFLILTSWADTSYPFGLIKGLPAVGTAQHYGIFPQQFGEALTLEDVLLGWESHNAQIIRGLKPGRHDDFLLSQSLADAEKGFCSEPMAWTELLRVMQGRAFRLIPRCVVEQANGKKRIIDNGDTGGQSERSVDFNKLVLCSALRPAQHVAAVASALGPQGWHARIQRDTLESGGEDWPEAYRHSPISEDESRGCIVAWYHHERGGPVFQQYSALLFGLPLAVTSFNRYSRFMEALGRRLTYSLTSMYFDDANLIDWASSKGSSQWAFEALNTAVGTPFAEEKRQAMQPTGTFLGLDHDLTTLREYGSVFFWAKERLLDKITGLISEAELTQTLAPGVAAKIYGMANFLEMGIYGRVGCAGLHALKTRQQSSHTSLTPELRKCFEVLREILRLMPRRELEVIQRPMARFIVASDAALERPREGTGGFHIVWFEQSPSDEGRESFVADIPDLLYGKWGPGDKKIAQLELAMVLYGLATRASRFRGRRGTWYIDNVAALMALIRGRSDNQDLEEMSGKIHAMLFALRTWIFWEWIPSKSNWADEISREGVRDTFGRRNRFHLFRARCPHELWPLPLRALLQVTEFL